MEIIKPDEMILTEYGIKLNLGEDLPFCFEFLISSVTHGCGRSTTDRQFYFINNRPCEPSKLMKLVNEIYKQFNSSQYPFVFMNITTKTLLVDVNVTPDKRQIFVENEKILLATVKASLLETFKVFPSVFKRENMDISQFLLEEKSGKSKMSKGIKRSATDGILKSGSILETFKKRSKTEGNILMEENISRNTKIALLENDVEQQAEKDLDMLVKIACKLTQKHENRESLKQKEPIVDVSDLNISLDVAPEVVPCRQTKIMEISLEEIQKNYNSTNIGHLDREIRVSTYFIIFSVDGTISNEFIGTI